MAISGNTPKNNHIAPNALYRSDRLNMWLYKLINDLNHTHSLWSGGHVNLSTGWLETVYGCHAYPKKTPNTRGGDYQTPPSYLGLKDSGWKGGVLHSDTNCMSSLANGILTDGRKDLSVPEARQLNFSPLKYRNNGVCMVLVAQLAEHRIVIPSVAGSTPVLHPIKTASVRYGIALREKHRQKVLTETTQ